MFEKYKKIQAQKKTLEQLSDEYHRELQRFAVAANSDLFQFFCEYFFVKREENRRLLELMNPENKRDREAMVKAIAENKVMETFVEDLENMKQAAEDEIQMRKDQEGQTLGV